MSNLVPPRPPAHSFTPGFVGPPLPGEQPTAAPIAKASSVPLPAPSPEVACRVLVSTGHGEASLTWTGRAIEFRCPQCAVPLEIGELGGAVQVCCCPQCQGFVIDSGTLGGLISELRRAYTGADDKPTPLNHLDLERHVACPACADIMEVHPYYGPGNVVIDSCLHCKIVWLNQGELNRIIRAPGRR